MWLRKLFFLLNTVIFVGICYLIVLFCDNNFVKCEVCYPASDNSGLLAQPKQIKNSKNRQNFVKNLVNEVLLGPIKAKNVSGKSKIDVNPFPKESKLLSLWLDGDTLFLDFNKELLLNTLDSEEKNANNSDLNLTKKNNCKFSLNYLILYSIINTVNLNCRSIKNFYLSFDGNFYKFIDGFGPMDGCLVPNFDIFIK